MHRPQHRQFVRPQVPSRPAQQNFQPTVSGQQHASRPSPGNAQPATPEGWTKFSPGARQGAVSASPTPARPVTQPAPDAQRESSVPVVPSPQQQSPETAASLAAIGKVEKEVDALISRVSPCSSLHQSSRSECRRHRQIPVDAFLFQSPATLTSICNLLEMMAQFQAK